MYSINTFRAKHSNHHICACIQPMPNMATAKLVLCYKFFETPTDVTQMEQDIHIL